MTRPVHRRTWLGLAVLGALIPPAWGHASTPAPSPAKRKLQNRLELWANFARKTENLTVQVQVRRESALLQAPLATTATLVFRAPDELVLRDNHATGSTTWVHGGIIEILPHTHSSIAPSPIDTQGDPAAAWLLEHLLALLSPPPSGALRFPKSRVLVPPGRGYRIELAPPRGSLARKLIRTLTVHLDPVAGAVTQIVIAEAQGDRVTLMLTDHRQNLDPADIQASFDTVTAHARDG